MDVRTPEASQRSGADGRRRRVDFHSGRVPSPGVDARKRIRMAFQTGRGAATLVEAVSRLRLAFRDAGCSGVTGLSGSFHERAILLKNSLGLIALIVHAKISKHREFVPAPFSSKASAISSKG